MSTSNICSVWLLLLCLAQASCAEEFVATSTPEELAQRSGALHRSSDGRGARGACRDGGAALLADLSLEAIDTAPPAFISRVLDADACEVAQGCVQGQGRRTLLTLPFAMRNVGGAAFVLSDAQFGSAECGAARGLRGFFRAELRDPLGRTLMQKSLTLRCAPGAEGVSDCAQSVGSGERALVPEDGCNVFDVSALEPGTYVLRISLHPQRTFVDASADNNSVEWTLDYPGCAGSRCGAGCCPEGVECRNGTCLLPDLRVSREAAAQALWLTERNVAENACELDERCVTGTGRRRLLHFESRVENWGPADLKVGPRENNPLFEYSTCRNRYLFRDFTDYSLRSLDGSLAAEGHKQSFCLFGMEPISDAAPAPPGTAPPGAINCNELPSGWSDVYGVDTPCQWIDVTDVPEGDYVLRVAVNPRGSIHETRVDNNVAKVPVHLPPDLGEPCQPRTEFCGDAVDQDCDGTPDAWDQDCWGGCLLNDPSCLETLPALGNETCGAAHELVAQGTYTSTLTPGNALEQTDACGGSGGAVYYRVTLPARRIVYLSSLRSELDTVIALYQGACDQRPLRCADDGCGTQNDHFALALDAGTYVVAVRAKHAGEAGVVRLKYLTAHPGGAEVLQQPGVYDRDTRFADDNLDVCGPHGDFAPDNVFALATCASTLQVSAQGRGQFVPQLALRANSVDGAPLVCSTLDGVASPHQANLTATVASGLTFLAVEGVRDGRGGRYRLSLSF